MMKPTKHLPLLLNTLPHSLLLRAEIAHKCTHRGDLTWLYCEAPKRLSFQMTQIPEAFHFVSSIIINLSFLFFFQSSLYCRPTAWLSVWVIHQPALRELCKNMHTCSASYFLSGPNTWCDQSPKKPGQEIEFFSTPGWVVQILEDECALHLTLHRRRPGPAEEFRRPQTWQQGTREKPRRSIGWEAGQLAISSQIILRLLPNKRKLKTTLPPT